ncbi:MAG TPA: winged helix-turn-helix domain-containing protein [Polyangiaceae bacterium]|nr:winged helix-turn-helix domain-containing protein [Polyangiaceae bacterium]
MAGPGIVLAEDASLDTSALRAGVAERGVEIRPCPEAEATLERLVKMDWDVLLVVAAKMRIDRLRLCRQLRDQGETAAIFICSNACAPIDIVVAHDCGADDHIDLQSDLAVVTAKIRRAVERNAARRSAVAPPSERSDERSLVVAMGLSPIEERLLDILQRSPGSTVDPATLMRAVWDRELNVSVLYEPLSRLRLKLRRSGWTIANVRGRGYRLVEQERPLARTSPISAHDSLGSAAPSNQRGM